MEVVTRSGCYGAVGCADFSTATLSNPCHNFTVWVIPHTPIPLLSWQLSTEEPLIGTACLELSPVPLHEQIKGIWR